MRTLLATLVCALLLAPGAATHDAHDAHESSGTHSAERHLTLEIVEDWSLPASATPARGSGGRPSSLAAVAAARQAAGSIVGRVEVRAATAGARRPAVTALSAPASRDVPAFRRAVVYLESAPTAAFDAPEPMRGRIDQRNETFLPHVLAVTVGSVVDFPNSDRTYHNVFSLSRTRRFDLGRYPEGASRAVRFDRAGVVRVFCDIHSHMSAFVLVFGHRYFAITDEEGRYRIDGIPPGTYTVAAWYEGEPRETRQVRLPARGGAADLDFNVP